MIRRYTTSDARNLTPRFGLVLTCCDNEVASFSLVADEDHPRITGDRGNVLVSVTDHDGNYTRTPSGNLLFENSAGGETSHGDAKIHVMCPTCPLDLQMTEDSLVAVLARLKNDELVGDVLQSELTLTARRMEALIATL